MGREEEAIGAGMSEDIGELASELLAAYLVKFPGEQARQEKVRERLAIPTGLLDRSDMRGHLTASAFIVCPVDQTLLLIHHASLDKWLQPGGHVDPGETPVVAARREAEEEVGMPGGAKAWMFDPSHPALPFDIDAHVIPARPKRNEGEHLHFDFRYAFLTPGKDWVQRHEGETLDFRWVRCEELRAIGVPEDLAVTAEKLFGLMR